MRRLNLAVVALTLFMLAAASFAQQAATFTVPNLIRYGGTLKDAQGAPLASSTVSVTSAVYKQQDGGAPVWMETQNVTTDAGGNYSVLLGAATATGLPADLFSQEEQRWLSVQVEGQAEQPRVLLVSVPYAFKAHEAETLGGKSVSDFVLANGANSSATAPNSSQTSLSTANNLPAAAVGTKKGAASDDPTNFSGSTTDQIVGVTQSGTGAGLNATSPNNAVVGNATGSYGYALYGIASGVGGIAVKGASTNISGTGVRGIETAPTGVTIGISSYVASPNGIAAVFNNAAGGKILSGQDNGVEQFSVDGSGNVNALGAFTGSGSGLTGIPFSNLNGTLASSQFNGAYSNPVTLSSTSNLYYGNGSNLTGIVLGAGSPYYVQNGTGQQSNASFNISGNGTSAGTLAANIVNSATSYQIGANSVLSIGTLADGDVFLGVGAGSHNVAGSGQLNTFSGYQAGYGNTSGQANTFSGVLAGRNNTTASYNTFSGTGAGEANNGSYNAFFGYEAGLNNTSGGSNTFYGSFAGTSNTTACCNVFSGYKAGYSTTTGGFNTFSGWKAGYSNSLGQNNTFDGYQAGYSNTGDSAGDGGDNAFFGYQAGYSNTLGFYNTFVGSGAGYSNIGDSGGFGAYNTFIGESAGYSNTRGSSNTFVGYEAGQHNTSGRLNTFVGLGAGTNATGNENTFSGYGAGTNATGDENTFVGTGAGTSTAGSNNIFLGIFAGGNNATGGNDIYIGNQGPASGTESNTIRIGDGEAAAYIDGVYGSTSSSGIPVYVNSNGQLGTQTSSLRFKEQVQDMGDSTSALMKLRPVTFLYKPEYDKGERTLQYGLIAEEVAKVYPELVAYDNDGQPYSVRYQYLSTMLLNEVQKQYRRAEEQTKVVESQQGRIESQQRQVTAQQQEIESLKRQLQLQNAAVQERLSRLEKQVGTQTAQK